MRHELLLDRFLVEQDHWFWCHERSSVLAGLGNLVFMRWLTQDIPASDFLSLESHSDAVKPRLVPPVDLLNHVSKAMLGDVLDDARHHLLYRSLGKSEAPSISGAFGGIEAG